MQHKCSGNRLTTILLVFMILINLGVFWGMAGIGAVNGPEPLGASRDTGNNNNFDNAEAISPGNHQGSVDVTTDPVDVYKIHLNGSSAVADIINISLEAPVIGLVGLVILFNVDLVEISWSVISNTQQTSIYEVAITTGTHYIMVASMFGTINYWLNVSVTQIANPQHDGNNDFANATTVNPGDSLTRNMNETYNYYDVYKLYAPKDMNITITADPSEDLGVEIYLYDAPNSSSAHLISEESGFTDDIVAVYNDTTIQEGWYYVYVASQGWAGPESMYGSYIINFTIRPPNTPPEIDLNDPKLGLWCDSDGLIIDEDTPRQHAIELPQHFTDDLKPFPPGGLNYWLESDDSNVSANIHINNSVSFTPADNWFGGPVKFTFYANDTVHQCCDTFNVTVLPVNDPPELKATQTWDITNGTINANNEIWVEQGQRTKIDIHTFDNDTANPIPDSLYFNFTFSSGGTTNLTSFPANFTFDENTGKIEYRSTNDDVGKFYIKVKVRDREDPSDIDVETDSRTIVFKVLNRNDNPILVSIITDTREYFIDTTDFYLPEFAIEDRYFNLTANATDPDYSTPKGDILTFSASSRLALWPATDLNRVKITVLPNNDDATKGYIEGRITVKDDDLLEDFVRLTIPVNNTNDPPEITYVGNNVVLSNKLVHFIGAESVMADEVFNFTIKAKDIDALDNLTFGTENESMTWGLDPELTIIQDFPNRSALISFKPMLLRGGTTKILNFTVEDDGDPTFSDYVNVMFDIIEVVIIEDKYTLTMGDCEKSYSDPENDVVTYERKTNDNIAASKGGEKGIDIISLDSRKFNENLIITVKCADSIENLGMLSYLYVYVVKSTFRENGTHLVPGDMDRTSWEAIAFEPPEDELYSGWLLDKFSASDIGGFLAQYENEITDNTWTITMELEDFENTFGVSHSTGFEIFAVGYDSSELKFEAGDMTNLFGPKSYDAAGYHAADAPEIGKATGGDGDDGSVPSEMDDVLLLSMIIIIIIAVIVIVIVAVFVTRKKKSQTEPAFPPGRPVAAPGAPPVEVTCKYCGWVIRDGANICPSCGAAAPAPPPPGMPCIYCTTIIPQGALKCPGCGSSAPDAPQIAAAPAQPTAPPPAQPPQYLQEPAPLPPVTTPSPVAATPPPTATPPPRVSPTVTPKAMPKVIPRPEAEDEKIVERSEELAEFQPESEVSGEPEFDMPESPFAGATIKELDEASDEPIIMDREAEEMDEE